MGTAEPIWKKQPPAESDRGLRCVNRLPPWAGGACLTASEHRNDGVGGIDQRLALIAGQLPRPDEGIHLVDEVLQLRLGGGRVPGLQRGKRGIQLGKERPALSRE